MKNRQVWAFIALSSITLFMFFWAFESRYIGWGDYRFQLHEVEILRVGFMIAMAMLLALWTFYPSYVPVVSVGCLSLIFPIIVGVGPETWGDFWPPVFETLCLLLLIGSTAIRRTISNDEDRLILYKGIVIISVISGLVLLRNFGILARFGIP